MNGTYWSAVATLLIGWFLNEIHHWFWSHREERKPFGKALADLLEIRHELKGLRTIRDTIKKRIAISERDEQVMKNLLQNISLLLAGDLRNRFDNAVTSIASVNPVLAFRLRSKDQFTPSLQMMRSWTQKNNEDKGLPIWFEDKLSDIFVENLEQLILDVARAHSLQTWWRIRKRLSKPDELPKEFDEILSLIPPSGDPTHAVETPHGQQVAHPTPTSAPTGENEHA